MTSVVRRGFADRTLEQCGSGDVKAKGLVDGVVAGCFPQLYTALDQSTRSSNYSLKIQKKIIK